MRSIFRSTFVFPQVPYILTVSTYQVCHSIYGHEVAKTRQASAPKNPPPRPRYGIDSALCSFCDKFHFFVHTPTPAPSIHPDTRRQARQSAPRHRHEAVKREDGSCQRRRPPGDGVDDVDLPIPDRRFRSAVCCSKTRSRSGGDGGEVVVTAGGEHVGGYFW